MLGQAAFDDGEPVETAHDVLRHAAWPAVDARDDVVGAGRQGRGDLAAGRRHQFLVGVDGDIASPVPAEVDAYQRVRFGRSSRPLARRPRAGEDIGVLDAGDDVAVAVEGA